MTEFAVGDGRIQVDVEATQAWYAAHGQLAGGCDCGYCRNFAAAVEGVPPAVGAFLARLGLDIRRPGEVMEWCREADGRHWYTAQYHVAGTVLAAPSGGLEAAPEVLIWFHTGQGPFLPAFPEPFFQVEADLRLPWLLDEPEAGVQIPVKENPMTGEIHHERTV